MQFQIADILVEIGARCGLHAKALPPERNFVEIEFEDLLLGQHRFDAHRQDHFLDFARHGIFVADQQVLRHLLGNGRSAARARSGAVFGGIIDRCAGKAGHIDPVVRKERFVLGRQKRADQGPRKIDKAQLHAPFARIGRYDLAVGTAHHRGQRRLIRQQLVGAGQCADKGKPHHRIDQPKHQHRNNQPARPAPRRHRTPQAQRRAAPSSTAASSAFQAERGRAGRIGGQVIRGRVGRHRGAALEQARRFGNHTSSGPVIALRRAVTGRHWPCSDWQGKSLSRGPRRGRNHRARHANAFRAHRPHC